MNDQETMWLSDSQQQTWRRWLAAHSEMTAALGRQLNRDWGMSIADFEVLVKLSEAPEGKLRIVELADAMAWERSRLSHHLTRMEKRELITRRDCPNDRRGAFAELTASGRSSIEQAAPGHAELVHSLLFADVSSEDLAAVNRVTTALLGRLSELR